MNDRVGNIFGCGWQWQQQGWAQSVKKMMKKDPTSWLHSHLLVMGCQVSFEPVEVNRFAAVCV